MDADVRPLPELLAQALFDDGGPAVRLFQGEAAVHAHVQVDGVAVADAAGAEMVGRGDTRIG